MNMNQNTKQVTFEEIKQDPDIRTYIKKADESLIALGFTEHSFAHVGLVAENSRYILETLGYPAREVELAQIAGYLHDIGNHDEGTGRPVSPMAAALILADKSDVRRSRVRNQDKSTFDIHDRVNYSVTKAELKINESKTLIKLKLHIDTRYGSVMDYFEIFLNRMTLCRRAAETLGLQFKLIINEQQLV